MNKGDKITIDYVCGHGSYELEIDSDDQKRNENRIKWFKENKVCTECYKKKMKKEDKKKPQVINCIYEKDEKNCYVTFYAEGNLDEHINELKSLGFKWVKTEHVRPNNSKYNTWELKLRYNIMSLKELKEFLDEFRSRATEIGYKLYSDMFGMSMEEIQKDLDNINKHKPKYNKCYEFLKEKFGLLSFNTWNKTIYTPKSGEYAGKNVCYIGNKQYCISSDQANLIKRYHNKLEEYYNSI